METREEKFINIVNQVMLQFPDIRSVEITHLDVIIDVMGAPGRRDWQALIEFQDYGDFGYMYRVCTTGSCSPLAWIFGTTVIRELNDGLEITSTSLE